MQFVQLQIHPGRPLVNGRRLRVLLVETDDRIRRLIGRFLERRGCVAELARDGHTGMVALRETEFDALILASSAITSRAQKDWQELACTMRARGAIVIVTGGRSPGGDSPTADGIGRIMPKPFRLEQLWAALRP